MRFKSPMLLVWLLVAALFYTLLKSNRPIDPHSGGQILATGEAINIGESLKINVSQYYRGAEELPASNAELGVSPVSRMTSLGIEAIYVIYPGRIGIALRSHNSTTPLILYTPTFYRKGSATADWNCTYADFGSAVSAGYLEHNCTLAENPLLEKLVLLIVRNKSEQASQLLNEMIGIGLTATLLPALYAAVAYDAPDDLLNRLAQSGLEINQPLSTTTNTTALSLAVRMANVSAVKILLNAGANTNLQDNGGKTALMHAVTTKGNREELVALLINNGADANAKDKDGRSAKDYIRQYAESAVGDAVADKDVFGFIANRSPLETAISSGDTDKVRELLAAGADVNRNNSVGQTAIFQAVKHNQTKLIPLLIASGADINQLDESGDSPLILAIRQKQLSNVVELIDRGADTSIKDRNALSLLAIAANYSALDIVEYLATRFRPDGDQMEQAISVAIKNQLPPDDMQRLITVLSPHINVDDKLGITRTLILLAIDNGRTEIIQALAILGWNANTDFKGMGFPLIYAARIDSPYALDALLKVGADPNIADQQGKTALMYAVEGDHYKSVLDLLNAGAKYSLADRRGYSAQTIAQRQMNFRLLDVFKDYDD